MSNQIYRGIRPLYPGDIVHTDINYGLIVRRVIADRVQVQVGPDWTWVWDDDLCWDGESLERVPRTEWGWRRLGRKLRKD